TPLPFVPENYRETVPSASLASTPQWPNFGVTPLEARECILAYDACTSFVDAQVGRLLKALDDLGLREKTVIVFWGDHGYHLGEHGLWRKNSLFEESARAPLIIDAPNTKGAGTACPSPVEFLDMYPTICELAGIKAPTAIEGKSLVPLLADPKAEWNRPAFTQVQFRQTGAIGRGVRTRRWRYVEWGNKGLSGRQLYDQETDPLEMKNLVASSEHRAVISELRELLHENFYRNTKHEN
ncbi:MAG: sulfatase/phosphatase domain-containing protein, partial [Limisphaerales bacterium]